MLRYFVGTTVLTALAATLGARPTMVVVIEPNGSFDLSSINFAPDPHSPHFPDPAPPGEKGRDGEKGRAGGSVTLICAGTLTMSGNINLRGQEGQYGQNGGSWWYAIHPGGPMNGGDAGNGGKGGAGGIFRVFAENLEIGSTSIELNGGTGGDGGHGGACIGESFDEVCELSGGNGGHGGEGGHFGVIELNACVTGLENLGLGIQGGNGGNFGHGGQNTDLSWFGTNLGLKGDGGHAYSSIFAENLGHASPTPGVGGPEIDAFAQDCSYPDDVPVYVPPGEDGTLYKIDVYNSLGRSDCPLLTPRVPQPYDLAAGSWAVNVPSPNVTPPGVDPGSGSYFGDSFFHPIPSSGIGNAGNPLNFSDFVLKDPDYNPVSMPATTTTLVGDTTATATSLTSGSVDMGWFMVGIDGVNYSYDADIAYAGETTSESLWQDRSWVLTPSLGTSVTIAGYTSNSPYMMAVVRESDGYVASSVKSVGGFPAEVHWIADGNDYYLVYQAWWPGADFRLRVFEE